MKPHHSTKTIPLRTICGFLLGVQLLGPSDSMAQKPVRFLRPHFRDAAVWKQEVLRSKLKGEIEAIRGYLSSKEGKKLPQKEKDKYRVWSSANAGEIKRLSKEISSSIAQDHSRFSALIKSAYADPTQRRFIDEYLLYQSIKGLNPKRTVTLALGQSARVEEVKALVQPLLERGYFILHDGEGPHAELIQGLAKERGFAVTQKQFSNPFMRLDLLSGWGKPACVTTPDSVMGAALTLNGDSTHILRDAKNPQASAEYLETWERFLKEKKLNLGVQFFPPKSINHLSDLLQRPLKRRVKPEIINPDLLKQDGPKLDFFAAEHLEHALNYAHTMTQIAPEIAQMGGSVIFGSSQSHDALDQSASRIAEGRARQNIPVTTGGAGGLMEAANRGAFKAGGLSIGIPIISPGVLANEKNIPTKTQTHTFGTLDYHERIPLLLEGKSEVIFEPGGSGTLRELAITLLTLADKPKNGVKVRFVSEGPFSEYYPALVQWLKQQPLPKSILNSIELYSTPKGSSSNRTSKPLSRFLC